MLLGMAWQSQTAIATLAKPGKIEGNVVNHGFDRLFLDISSKVEDGVLGLPNWDDGGPSCSKPGPRGRRGPNGWRRRQRRPGRRPAGTIWDQAGGCLILGNGMNLGVELAVGL